MSLLSFFSRRRTKKGKRIFSNSSSTRKMRGASVTKEARRLQEERGYDALEAARLKQITRRMEFSQARSLRMKARPGSRFRWCWPGSCYTNGAMRTYVYLAFLSECSQI